MSTTMSKTSATSAVTTYAMAAIEQLEKLDKSWDPDFLRAIIKPKREIVVEIPLRKDDGRFVTFQGYRVQHNDARGPFKGGLRYHPTVDLNEARTLAQLMSLKTAVVNIPLRRRQRRHRLRSQKIDAARIGKIDAQLHQLAWRQHWTDERHSGAGREHKRANYGVDC